MNSIGKPVPLDSTYTTPQKSNWDKLSNLLIPLTTVAVLGSTFIPTALIFPNWPVSWVTIKCVLVFLIAVVSDEWELLATKIRWVSPASMVKISERPAELSGTVHMPTTSRPTPIWVRAESSEG